jgi:predicted AAA+ superfamily ATPase
MIIKVFPSKMPTFRVSPGLPKVRPAAPGHAPEEVGMDSIDGLWYRGGFPRSFLAAPDEDSRSWRRDFVRTFLERDLPALGVTIPSATLRQFWTMLAHYHGQTWNGSELARAFGVSQPTVQRYRDLLAGAYVLRILRPWSENVGKRIVKSPKVYIRDSGILHTLLGLADRESLFGHPKVGASFEGLVVELLTRRLRAEPEECFFWATHAGAELDLLVISGDIRLGFEVKRTTSPKVTKSMTSARETLGLELVRVVHAGRDSYPLQEGFRAVSVHQLLDEV